MRNCLIMKKWPDIRHQPRRDKKNRITCRNRWLDQRGAGIHCARDDEETRKSSFETWRCNASRILACEALHLGGGALDPSEIPLLDRMTIFLRKNQSAKPVRRHPLTWMTECTAWKTKKKERHFWICELGEGWQLRIFRNILNKCENLGPRRNTLFYRVKHGPDTLCIPF